MNFIKIFLGLCILVFVGVVGWRLGGKLSSDAIGMALGILFGIMAGIPASLIVLAGQRRDGFDDEPRRPQNRYHELPHQTQPPVIVVTNYGEPSPIDNRLKATGEITEDGYHLMRAERGIKVSEMARQHQGYSVARLGGYIGFKPLSNKAQLLLEMKERQ